MFLKQCNIDKTDKMNRVVIGAFYERCVKEQVAFKWLLRVPEQSIEE